MLVRRHMPEGIPPAPVSVRAKQNIPNLKTALYANLSAFDVFKKLHKHSARYKPEHPDCRPHVINDTDGKNRCGT